MVGTRPLVGGEPPWVLAAQFADLMQKQADSNNRTADKAFMAQIMQNYAAKNMQTQADLNARNTSAANKQQDDFYEKSRGEARAETHQNKLDEQEANNKAKAERQKEAEGAKDALAKARDATKTQADPSKIQIDTSPYGGVQGYVGLNPELADPAKYRYIGVTPDKNGKGRDTWQIVDPDIIAASAPKTPEGEAAKQQQQQQKQQQLAPIGFQPPMPVTPQAETAQQEYARSSAPLARQGVDLGTLTNPAHDIPAPSHYGLVPEQYNPGGKQDAGDYLPKWSTKVGAPTGAGAGMIPGASPGLGTQFTPNKGPALLTPQKMSENVDPDLPALNAHEAGFSSSVANLPPQYKDLVLQASQKYGVNPDVIASLVHQESRGNPNATSPKGAGGIMQIMPGTARDLGADPYNPSSAIPAGTRYLAQGLQKYGGNTGLALAAYNAGSGTVDNYLRGGRLPAETRDYVLKITGQPIEAWASGAANSGGTLDGSAASGGGRLPQMATPMAGTSVQRVGSAQVPQVQVPDLGMAMMTMDDDDTSVSDDHSALDRIRAAYTRPLQNG